MFTSETRTSDKNPYIQTSAQVRQIPSEKVDVDQGVHDNENVFTMYERGVIQKGIGTNRVNEQLGTSQGGSDPNYQGGTNTHNRCYNC